MAVDYVKIVVRTWFRRLIEDVTVCAERGGTASEIDIIVHKANETIEAELAKVIVKGTEKNSTELVSTTQWAKGLVLQGSAHIEAIGVQIISGSASTSAKDSLYSYVEATEKQIYTAYEKVDSSLVIEVDTKYIDDHKKIEKPVHKAHDTHKAGEIAGIIAGGGVVAVGAVDYVKTTVSSWFTKLVKDVTERAEQGGDNAQVEIEAIVTKATATIEGEFTKVSTKVDTGASADQFKSTLEWAKGLVTQTTTQVQAVAVQAVAAGTVATVHDQLTTVVESTKTQVHTAFESCKTDVVIEVDSKEVCHISAYIATKALTFI